MAEYKDKPTAAFVLSLIGGIFILLGGIVIAFVGALATLAIGGVGIAIGGAGIAMGLVIIVGSVMMESNPDTHVAWGVIILILSIFSWLTALGGFVIGFLLGLIGSILALTYHPS